MLERPEIGLWVVADGMGGHDKGDVASQMIIEHMKKMHEGTSLVNFIDDLETGMQEVNRALIEKAKSSARKSTIGSTVVIMITFDKYLIYVWAGDSRLYRLRNADLRQITTDHSQVELYVEQGLITREDALKHPHGNMITRAIGAMEDLYLDMDIQELARADRYLLCSDGLTKHLQDFEIQEMLQNSSTEECCNSLIELTLERGAGDNVTAIIVDIE